MTAGLMAASVPAAHGRTIIVGPHESIQAAVDRAAPGDTIAIRPGTYHEAGRPCPTEPGTCAVVVTKDAIALVARRYSTIERRPVLVRRRSRAAGQPCVLSCAQIWDRIV